MHWYAYKSLLGAKQAKVSSQGQGISKPRTEKEWGRMNGTPGKFTYHHVTANVCVPTPILCPTSYKNHQWVAMKVVCKLNYCILGRNSSVRQRRHTGS